MDAANRSPGTDKLQWWTKLSLSFNHVATYMHLLNLMSSPSKYIVAHAGLNCISTKYNNNNKKPPQSTDHVEFTIDTVPIYRCTLYTINYTLYT